MKKFFNDPKMIVKTKFYLLNAWIKTVSLKHSFMSLLKAILIFNKAEIVPNFQSN